MMNPKKQTVLRLILFCVLAFLPLYVLTPILNAVCGEPIFAGKNTISALAAQTFCTFAMFAPSLAHLLTRLITREGFHHMYLMPNLSGNARYYAASILVKIAEPFASLALIWLIFTDLPFAEAFTAGSGGESFALTILQVTASIAVFFPAFGEEWGWRGYMMPKVLELMPKPAAILTGGIIWGLWHAPLTVSGHNFGVDYPGFPWLGILAMCGYCVLVNALLTLLTEKTRSIYPAAFCHMINNNVSFFILLSLFGSGRLVQALPELSALDLFFAILPLPAVTGAVSLFLLMKKKKS